MQSSGWVTLKEEKRDIFSVVVMGDMREELMKGKIQERRRAELKLFRREQSSMIVCVGSLLDLGL